MFGARGYFKACALLQPYYWGVVVFGARFSVFTLRFLISCFRTQFSSMLPDVLISVMCALRKVNLCFIVWMVAIFFNNFAGAKDKEQRRGATPERRQRARQVLSWGAFATAAFPLFKHYRHYDIFLFIINLCATLGFCKVTPN